ncbi:MULTISPECIES: GcrA family cell cycle regulator [unclassified Bradyrhizobium]|uniref:GcrA family cell cycle regulator n=1 Tax=unclassified Bradyrhizobium TaxID=2631580 RepID=UPI0028F0CB12|nr:MULTISPECIES: GcrA family cell cycle regulator [unclassified Bradyrhizobium]
MAVVKLSEVDLARARCEQGWTAHRLKVVQKLYNVGKSAAEIAALIGGVTRNAVIGKIHRAIEKQADWINPDRSRQSRAPKIDTARAAPRLRKLAAARARPTSPPDQQPQFAIPTSILDKAIPGEHRKTLIQLDDTCCKWPVGNPGEPGFFFCGMAKPDNGRPYCSAHERRAKGAPPRHHFRPPLRGPRATNFIH